jgi:hypothetical protein
MAELQMFQPGKAFYDAYQQGRGNHLAGLAMNSQGEQRQSALAQLAGIDAGAAASMKKGLDDQDRAELAEFSNVILNVPDELKPQVYSKGVQRFGQKFRDLGIEPPADYTQAMPLFQQFAGGQGATPSDVQSFDYFAQGMAPEEKEKARRIKLGLDQKVGAESIKYLPNGGAAYEDPVSKKVYMINPGETTWREFSYPTAMGGQGQTPVTQAPPPAADHNAIATNLQQILREAGFDEQAARDVADAYHSRKSAEPKGQYTDGVYPIKPSDQAKVAQQSAGGGWVDTSKPKEAKPATWNAPVVEYRGGKPVKVRYGTQDGQPIEEVIGAAEVEPKTPTQDQSNAAGFFSRMQQSERIIAQIEAEGYSPASNKGDYFSAGGTFTNWATSPKGQQYYNAATNWIRANLRKESGAAIGVDEAKQEYATYFPIPGDTKETIEQKRQLRQQTIEAVRGAGMPAMKYQDNQNNRAPAGKVHDPLGILK